jgi:hypothetical protein
MTVSFELDGHEFLALNGGPDFTFDEAISCQVFCKDQEEVDAYWSKLSAGGEEGPCGWLKDQVRTVVADRPDGPAPATGRSGPGKGTARHGSDAEDEED